MEKKADFKTMKKSEIAGFIWDYYKWWIIGSVIVIAAAVSLIHHFVTAKAAIVEMALVNCGSYATEEEKEPDFSDFMDQYGYDKKKQEVVLQTSFSVDLTSTDSGNAYSYEALMTQIAAGGIDVFAADDEVYEYLAGQQYFANLSDYLSEEQLKQYGDTIVFVTDPETKEDYPAGIRLKKNTWMEHYGFYPEGCIIGILTGTSREEAAQRLLFYVLEENRTDSGETFKNMESALTYEGNFTILKAAKGKGQFVAKGERKR